MLVIRTLQLVDNLSVRSKLITFVFKAAAGVLQARLLVNLWDNATVLLDRSFVNVLDHYAGRLPHLSTWNL